MLGVLVVRITTPGALVVLVVVMVLVVEEKEERDKKRERKRERTEKVLQDRRTVVKLLMYFTSGAGDS